MSNKKNQHTPSYIEITYCKPGEPWRRKVVSSRRLESVVLRLDDEGPEILTRELAE